MIRKKRGDRHTHLLIGTEDNAKLVCKLEDESLLLIIRVVVVLEFGEDEEEEEVECCCGGELKSLVFLCCIDFDVELLLLFALALLRFASLSDAKYGINVLHTHRRYASCNIINYIIIYRENIEHFFCVIFSHHHIKSNRIDDVIPIKGNGKLLMIILFNHFFFFKRVFLSVRNFVKNIQRILEF